MTTIIFSCLNIPPKPSIFLQTSRSFHRIHRLQKFNIRNLTSLCTKDNLPWEKEETESSIQFPTLEENKNNTSIFQQSNILDPIDSLEPPQIPFFSSQTDQNIFELNLPNSKSLFNLKSPMWILGPLVLFITGIVPTLWLPLSSVFVGPTIAGLFSLIGLDCIFNMGAMIFLLMADSSAPPSQSQSQTSLDQIAPNYRAWNFGASIIGFITPFIVLFLSSKGSITSLLPQVSFISFLVLVGPYLLLLAIQMVTEALTWHWRSPVWLITPVVYEGYRVLQLMRGISLGNEIGVPLWMVQTLRGLVSWWILVLGIQLMRVSWFVGSTCETKSEAG